MSPMQPIPTASKRLKALAFAALIASTTTLAGCQQMGFRSRSDELKHMIAEQDDWALPPSAQSKVPRPIVSNSVSRKRDELPNRLTQQMQSQSRVSRSSTAELDSESDDSLSIKDTNAQEIDVEGAMATLPAKYREVLKKQLDLSQQKTKTALNENRSLAEKSVSDPPATEGTILAVHETQNEKPTGKVTVKMSDEKTDHRDSTLNSSVVSAIAISHPTIDGSDPTSSQILKATAISPIHSNASNVSSNSTIPPAQVPAIAAQPTGPNSWRQLLNQSIEQLEKQIKETPLTDENLRVSQEVTLRMLYLSQRRLNDATREIDHLSDQEQDYFRHQMHALFEASNPDAMPVRSRHWSLVMNSQREATNLLAAISNLEVKSAAFCTEVEGYGIITKFPKNQFDADQELLLYCEVDNVAASKVKDGFESQLQGSYEIIDSHGRKVADQLLPVKAEVCQNHRRDYFIVYKIFTPQQIAAGNYQLRLTIEDTKARKFGQSQLDFQIKK